jgi:Glycoside hydrolase family 44
VRTPSRQRSTGRVVVIVALCVVAASCAATTSGTSATASPPGSPTSLTAITETVPLTAGTTPSIEMTSATEAAPALAPDGPDEPGTDVPAVVVQNVYFGGLATGWTDAGWSADRVVAGGPATIDLGDGGGWLLQGQLSPKATALEFRFRPPRELGAFVLVTVGAGYRQNVGREVLLANSQPGSDGWTDVRIPLMQLNPKSVALDALRFRSARRLASPFRVEFDRIRLTAGGSLRRYGSPSAGAVPNSPSTAVGATAAANAKAPRTTARRVTKRVTTRRSTPTSRGAAVPTSTIGSSANAAGALPAPTLVTDTSMSVDCRSNVKAISPLIYGIGWAGAFNQRDVPWDLSATANRWGGNPTSRYNWQLGNAWNTANDYFFRNVQISDAPNAMDTFLAANDTHGLASAVSVPALGWVAKDTSTYSFPVQQFGRQQYNDPDIPDAGNGMNPSGKRLVPGSPKRTSVESTPASIAEWVRSKLTGRVTMYFIDNEPELWESTHADVHPEAVGYDEILSKTIEYASAVRQGDPSAVIAGPSSWGWPAYSYSGIDAKAGFDKAPDRKAHGNLPFLPWYLQEVRAYEQKRNVKLLNLLDVHFYPAANGVFSNNADPETAALRIRQVRGLWDRSYADESWVGEAIYLIPRLRAWIDKYDPGLGISIGEWNFGGENHMSGGLATAEALGRFGTEGVTSAYYWTAPPPGSPSAMAFRAFRNFDGVGGKFLDISVDGLVNNGNGVRENVSLFASKNADQSQLVFVMLNTSPSAQRVADVALKDCGRLQSFEIFRYTGGSQGFEKGPSYAARRDSFSVTLPPYSMTVVRAQVR